MANFNRLISYVEAALVLSGIALWISGAQAQPLTWATSQQASLPNGLGGTSDSGVSPDTDIARETAANLSRQVVDYSTSESPGVIVVDTPRTYLYFVLGGGKAIRYGIGVGREGFTWSGTNSIERKSEWPDWIPPHEMLERQPYLPRFMAGGEGNPLGARAMYLGGTEYRIHGTNAPSTIGERVSSGCIRMLNADVIDLYGRTHVGTKVVVLPMNRGPVAQIQPAARAANARMHVATVAQNLR